MAKAKVVLLVTYAVLAGLALTQGDSALGVWSLRLLMLLAVVHLIEVAVFFKLCQQAGGSMLGHVINLFLFGVVHAQEVKDKVGSAPT